MTRCPRYMMKGSTYWAPGSLDSSKTADSLSPSRLWRLRASRLLETGVARFQQLSRRFLKALDGCGFTANGMALRFESGTGVTCASGGSVLRDRAREERQLGRLLPID